MLFKSQLFEELIPNRNEWRCRTQKNCRRFESLLKLAELIAAQSDLIKKFCERSNPLVHY